MLSLLLAANALATDTQLAAALAPDNAHKIAAALGIVEANVDLQQLEQSLAKDHARHQISPVSPLGLVEMTRKRIRESLQHVLCEDCPTCEGRGFVMTAETVCFEIFREIIRQSRQFEFDEVMVLAGQEVIELLLDEQAPSLATLEEQTGKSIRLQPEALYVQDQFDVVLM